ncbi:hypothetical protein LINGRAHAP2_LOCUS29343 [Linum grandiflorum]
MNIPPFFSPTGSKFIPTDKELVEDYLYNYIHGYLTPEHCYLVQEANLYGEKEPWDLWKDHQIRSLSQPQETVYLFTKLKKKSANSKYFERGIGNGGGCWHGESSDTDNSKFRGRDGLIWTAEKRTFKYKNTKSASDEHGKWLMYEFRIGKGTSFESETVVCALKNNGSPTAETELGNNRLTRKRKLDDISDGILDNHVPEFSCPNLKKLREQSNSVVAVPIMLEKENTTAIVPIQNETTEVSGSGAEEMELMKETVGFSEVLEEDPYLERLTFTFEELVGEESSVEVIPLIPTETKTLEADEDDPELEDFAFFLEEQLDTEAEPVADIVHNNVNVVNQEEEPPISDHRPQIHTVEQPQISDHQPATPTGKDNHEKASNEALQMLEQQPWFVGLMEYTEAIDLRNWDCDDFLPLPFSYVTSF